MTSLYVILKFLHILLAITAVGADITYGVWLSRAAREPDSPEYQAAAGRAQRTGILLAVIVVIIVFLMVTKPALWS